MPASNQLIAADGAFVALAVWLFLFVRFWHGHLLKLAQQYDIVERRRRAALHYSLILPLLVGPIAAVMLWIMYRTTADRVTLVVGFAVSLLPALIWWWRNVSDLKKLGYGQTDKTRPTPQTASRTKSRRRR